MAELLNKKQLSINENYSWVYSLPFFPQLIKRIKIILLIHLTNRHYLIKSIRSQRINAANKIIRAYKNFILINQMKREFFIRKIISDRKNSIIKIQRYIKYYFNRKLLKSIIRKEKGCYTIICNKSNVAKISIKIFTDYKDSDKSTICPMRFCPFRNIFFFPIPKTKFILADKNNKIVNFNFIYKGNIFFDDYYKIKDFNGKKVHTVNFSEFDIIEEKNFSKKIENDFKNDDCYNLSHKTKRYKSSSVIKNNNNNNNNIIDFSSDEEEENKRSRKASKDLLDVKKKKYDRGKKKGRTCKIKNPCLLGLTSILKERNCDRKYRKRRYTIGERHVQFGTVTFSY